MKIIRLLIALLLGACGSPQENSSSHDAPGSNVVPESTACEFPELKLPPTFYHDSISVYDSASHATYDAHVLQSSLPQMKIFNNKIMKAMEERVQWEQSYVDPCDENTRYACGYAFNLKPTAFYSNKDVISITHVVDTYGAGGNHHNCSWFTFNFDLKKNEHIHFKDIFNLPHQKDSIAFAASVRENSIMGNCMDWDVPFNPVDFSFTDNGIYINPDLSWACSQNRSLLPMDSLRKYLKPGWMENKSK